MLLLQLLFLLFGCSKHCLLNVNKRFLSLLILVAMTAISDVSFLDENLPIACFKMVKEVFSPYKIHVYFKQK